jgi:deazaflavin-dependent oxidoreductase (nitroreductase family)
LFVRGFILFICRASKTKRKQNMIDINDPGTLAQLRRLFKRFNQFMIPLWRLGLRRWVNIWPEVGGRILVIAHTGRKSGLRRLTPVNYAEVDGELYVSAGFGAVSDWYRNILAHPQVELWLPDSRWQAVAEDISDSPQRNSLLRQVLIGSGAVAPMMGLNPRTLSDADLAAVTSEYRVVRLRRQRPVTGPGGPGDLAWVWGVIGFLVIGSWLLVKRRSR